MFPFAPGSKKAKVWIVHRWRARAYAGHALLIREVSFDPEDLSDRNCPFSFCDVLF